jgi:hypothetical protein
VVARYAVVAAQLLHLHARLCPVVDTALLLCMHTCISIAQECTHGLHCDPQVFITVGTSLAEHMWQHLVSHHPLAVALHGCTGVVRGFSCLSFLVLA